MYEIFTKLKFCGAMETISGNFKEVVKNKNTSCKRKDGREVCVKVHIFIVILGVSCVTAILISTIVNCLIYFLFVKKTNMIFFVEYVLALSRLLIMVSCQ